MHNACLAQGCMECTWSPIWALSCSLCGNLQHRGARAELHHQPAAQRSQGIAPPPRHQHTSIRLTPWTAIWPTAYTTPLTHWTQIAQTPLQSLVNVKLEQKTPPLASSRLPQKQKSNGLPIQNNHLLQSHAYTCCQEPFWSTSYHRVNRF